MQEEEEEEGGTGDWILALRGPLRTSLVKFFTNYLHTKLFSSFTHYLHTSYMHTHLEELRPFGLITALFTAMSQGLSGIHSFHA